MMNVGILNEESRMSRLLKDERGMTLIELLATVVILAVIAGIGVTAIGKVIQNSKEDAGIANVQQAFNAAKLYQATNVVVGEGNFKLSDVINQGYLEVSKDVWTDPATISFKSSRGALTVHIPKDSLKAGEIGNNELAAGTTIEQVLGLKRGNLFGNEPATTP